MTENTDSAGAATATPAADPHANPGTAESQIEFLTRRIQSITEHLKVHRKDHTTRRGLLMLVGQRSRLLKYLKRKDEERYQSLIKRLGLRK